MAFSLPTSTASNHCRKSSLRASTSPLSISKVAALIIGAWLVGISAVAETTAQNTNVRNIITAGGTITEVVFALGAGDQVVAVDQSSQYPQAATQLPMVGYYRDLAVEGVLAFMPQKLMALEGTGSPEVLEQLVDIGVDVRIYDKPTSVEELMNLIALLGEDLNRQKEAGLLQTQIRISLPDKKPTSEFKAVYLLSVGERGLIAAGKETVPQLLFDYNGIQNLANSHLGFKGVNSEVLAMLQPDFLVAPAHVVRGMGGTQAFCQAAALQLLEAAQNCRLLVMDSLISLGMTPRLAKAIKAINRWQDTMSKE